MRRLLERLFGERPAAEAVAAFMGQHVQDNLETKSLYLPGTGGVPALGSVAAPAVARAMPRSTPFGD